MSFRFRVRHLIIRITLQMEFTFDPQAGNEFQGATCGFDLEFFGCQDISQIP